MSTPPRPRTWIALLVLLGGVLGLAPTARAQNAVSLENQLPGQPASEWDVSGAGDPSIVGFAQDISFAPGETVDFRIESDASDYRLDLYRMGWYGGDGARKQATIEPSASLPQTQPACLTDGATGLVDCGNWAVSASWTIPVSAVSGIYFAKLVREDPEDGRASQVFFVVRDDDGGSDLLFQTADTTRQAYNQYGGNSLYAGGPGPGRAYAVSYNRPVTTRDYAPEDAVFNSEYPLVRWLERNGYDVSYSTGVDTDRRGAELLEHDVFLSVGHDEYWSAAQRANVEAARDAGVHLAFLSGNEIFWKTRWAPSLDGSATPYRTMISYKETHAGAKIDPEAAIWTGTWRDPRLFNPEGPQPENALTGQLFTVNCCAVAIEVPEADGKLRFWRNTDIATLLPGQTATLPSGTLGYEWDEDVENDLRPPGMMRLSTTTVSVPQLLQDHGSSYAPGDATHHLTLYRASSGALVFGAGTIQWSWGLDDEHDGGSAAPDLRMQQATVNLLADMNAQPATLQLDLVLASASTDGTAPVSTIVSPLDGATVTAPVTIQGTAADAGGGVVGGVEISVDGGATWRPAEGRESWSFSFSPASTGLHDIRSRAVDDSGHLETPGAGITVDVAGPQCPCSIWNDTVVPTGNVNENDGQPLELGMKFRADEDGFVTALRFYRSPSASGPHSGRLWTSDGTLLAEVDYTALTGSGWQQVALDPAIEISANTTYIVSYHTPNAYAFSSGFFTGPVDAPPLHALADGEDGANAVYAYAPAGTFPTATYQSSNYWVDLVFETDPGSHTLFGDAALPAQPAATDGQPIEVGLKLRAEVPGAITALRFYKGLANTGIHTGHVWTTAGGLLAEASFTGESAEGWQEVELASPLAIAADTTIVVSVHSASGYFALDVGGLASGFENRPLRALADGEEGANGVFAYGSNPSFPAQDGNGNNFWVDARFLPDTPFDADPPIVLSRSPLDGATNVPIASLVSATFDEPIDPATLSLDRFELRDGANALVSASVAFDAPSRTATLTPDAALAPSTVYTATLVGGVSGVLDLAGNPLAADVVWTFTTADPPAPPPDEGPGGPILVVASASNPYGRYLAEILRNEGLNYFQVTDISNVDAPLLASHEVVLLGEQALDPGQVAMFTAWVDGGGKLVAMRPDAALAGLLGLIAPSGTVSDAYLAIDTAQAPGTGLVAETIQYHGPADLWTLDGASELATLYGDATTASSHPALTLNSVGSNGGFAAAFTYDLARSVVWTRQGNPDWIGQERDGTAPLRSDDMFYGAAAGDVQPDWIDLDKVAIPQADEQQRLLVKLLQEMVDFPMPQFWYFPSDHKAIVLLNADQHGCCGGTRDRFNDNLAADPPGCSLEDWECVRSSSYIYPGPGMSDAEALAFHNQGFELGVHVNTGCANWTPAELDNYFATQLASFASLFPSLPSMDSHRTHCIAWSDWSSEAEVELVHGVRLDTNYYYWPPGWVQDTPGLFTGSGMPMRFAALDGTMIDVYQAATQMTDESGQSYPFTIDTLLDRALGPEGYFGVFTANMHTDGGSGSIAGADAIVASAQARGVPVVSGRQMLEWLDGRNGSTFANLQPGANSLAFDLTKHSAARNLRALLPGHLASAALTGLTRDGTPVPWTTQIVKGTEVARFDGESGHYVASYGVDATPPSITDLVVTPGPGDTATVSWSTDEPADSRVDFGIDPIALVSSVSSAAFVTNHSLELAGLLSGTTYHFRATSLDLSANAATAPPLASAPASFATMAVACASDVTQADFAAGVPDTGLSATPIGDGALALAASEDETFDGTSLPAGWFETPWSGGGAAIVSGGTLSVDGALSGTSATFASGRSLEFQATFESVPLQHVGFAETLNAPPWAIFSTGSSGSTLQARTNGASSVDTSLPGVALGVPHRFRIDWSASNIDYFVDGAPVASHPIAIAAAQSVLVSDLAVDATSVGVDWLRLSPYAAAGVFESRVFDAGTASSWDGVSWSSEVAAGTTLSVSVRAGDTPVPDGSWSSYAAVAASGDPAGVVGRYVQYRVDLASAVSSETPVLHDLSLACSPLALCGNGALDGAEECDDGNGLPGDGCSASCLFESLDADNDGLTNLEEQGLGTNPLIADTDGDGFSDGDEVAAGTNPLDPEDFPFAPPSLPTLGPWAVAILVLGLIVIGGFAATRRRPSD